MVYQVRYYQTGNNIDKLEIRNLSSYKKKVKYNLYNCVGIGYEILLKIIMTGILAPCNHK